MIDLEPVSLVEIQSQLIAAYNLLMPIQSNFVPNFKIAKGYFPPSEAEKMDFSFIFVKFTRGITAYGNIFAHGKIKSRRKS